MEYSQHHTLLSTLVRQLKVTTYQCWISVYAPLFWFLSATFQFPDKHQAQFEFTHNIQFLPSNLPYHHHSTPPNTLTHTWETQPTWVKKQRSLRSLKDHIASWKKPNLLDQRRGSSPSLSQKEPRIPFLRRFSSSSSSSSSSNNSTHDLTFERKKGLKNVLKSFKPKH